MASPLRERIAQVAWPAWATAPPRSSQPGRTGSMNARAIELVAGGRERWPLAGDQLYVDLCLGVDNVAVTKL